MSPLIAALLIIVAPNFSNDEKKFKDHWKGLENTFPMVPNTCGSD